MKIEKFEDIISWQKAKELTIRIYNIFQGTNDFGFKNQIERASVSIMNNIAEGFDRQTRKEFIQFLYIAKGSNAEVRSMLNLAKDLNKISDEDFLYLYQLSEEISKLLYGFIKSLKNSA
jgi:four helix bundle protein